MIFGLPSVTAMPAKNSLKGESDAGSAAPSSATGAVHIFQASQRR